MRDSRHIVIVGGGTAGVSVAARLKNEIPAIQITLIEPSEQHYYQPLWTLVGAGIFPASQSCRPERTLIPAGVTWLKDRVSEFMPDESAVLTEDGRKLMYSTLVVCPGIQINWNAIRGLEEAMGHNGVCSNYSIDYVDSTWQNICKFAGGTALFTQPSTAIKCGGAPQKIAYLAEDYFRLNGIRDKCKVVFATAQAQIFSVKKYADALTKVVRRKEIDALFGLNLIEIHGDKKEAVFDDLVNNTTRSIKYDMLHVTPPMGPPDFIKSSSLADSAGWVEVDKNTLQHARFKNVFALGDSAGLPTSKTGAAIRKQAPVVVNNILCQIAEKNLSASYDGYSSCPWLQATKV